jgi:hypothetical protein
MVGISVSLVEWLVLLYPGALKASTLKHKNNVLFLSGLAGSLTRWAIVVMVTGLIKQLDTACC